VPERLEYAVNRYTNEVKRLHGVMESASRRRRIRGTQYSIADIAIFRGCGARAKSIDWAEFPKSRSGSTDRGAPRVQRFEGSRRRSDHASGQYDSESAPRFRSARAIPASLPTARIPHVGL